MFEYINLAAILRKCPKATAAVKGSEKYRNICGKVSFYEVKEGVLVIAAIDGLPQMQQYDSPVFGFHIHEGCSCSGDSEDPFRNALTHYNPTGYPHPYHAGDMPPLFANRMGSAFLSFVTDRFKVREIIGRTVIIHSMPDDFTTQPSGNAGEKIACGSITG